VPEVSVIIPTYNRERFVVRAVQSVLNQTFSDLELIVVDDGSTDDTRSTLQQFSGRIRYLHQHNGGVSAARNNGIRAASGRWLAFLDSDDEWRSDYLARQIEWTLRTPGLCMQTSDCMFTGHNGERHTYFEMNGIGRAFKENSYVVLNKPFCFVVEHAPWQVGATLFRADAVAQAGLFDPNLSITEDLDLIARVSLQGPLGLIRDALVDIYRREDDSVCLTGKARNHPLESRKSDERLYAKLSRINTLTRAERQTLNCLRSANWRAIGNLLLQDGRSGEAMACYKEACRIAPSPRSFAKYLLALAQAGLRLRRRQAVGGSQAGAKIVDKAALRQG
jgi:glycosyltransferase involved in cell wall biosynthesis